MSNTKSPGFGFVGSESMITVCHYIIYLYPSIVVPSTSVATLTVPFEFTRPPKLDRCCR